HRMHPHRRYIVIHHDLDPEYEYLGRFLGIFKRWFLGHLEVRRSLNLETSTAVVLRATDAQMDTVEFLHGDSMRFALLLSLPFETKLEQLNWLLQTPGELSADLQKTGHWLIRAIVVDLAEEQAALRTSRGPLDEKVFEERLSYLVRLRDVPLSTLIDVDSNKWQLLFDLSAGIEGLGRSQKPWWAWFGRHKKVTGFMLECLERFNYETFSRFAIDM